VMKGAITSGGRLGGHLPSACCSFSHMLASLPKWPLRRLTKDGTPAPPDSPALLFRLGTLILEPGRPSPGSECRYRLMRRTRNGVEHLSGRDYDLTAAEALFLILFTLAPQFGLTREEVLGMSPEDIASAAGL
jgi:hypothetical protein